MPVVLEAPGLAERWEAYSQALRDERRGALAPAILVQTLGSASPGTERWEGHLPEPSGTKRR